MFGVQISLAFLCALQLSVFAQALSIEKPSPLSITQAQDLSRPNASAIFSTTGRTRFPIPESSLTLVLQQGRALNPGALEAVLDAAAALVAKKIVEHGGNAGCDLVPFGHDLAGGVKLDIWPTVDFLTWAQLRIVIRGLQIFQVEGRRFHSYHFEIHDSEKLDIYTLIGWGNTGKPWGFPRTQLLESASSSISSRLARRAVDLPSASPNHKIFRVPGSQLILVLRPRAAIRPEFAKAILLTADAWVARKISIFGENSPADVIFDYKTGDRPYTRLIVWSSMVKNLTWGQLKTVIDGLWIVLVDRLGYRYTYFEIFDRKVDVRSQLGWGAVLENGDFGRKPSLEITPSNSTLDSTSATSLSTSKRALRLSTAGRLSAINESDPTVSTYIFEIPNSDMKLEIHNLTNPSYDCARRSLLALVLNAAAEFNGDVARFGKDTPSAGLEYVLMMPGLELRLLKVFIPPFGYMTYDQLRTMVLGLQLYMIIGKRPQAIGFKVLFGDDDVVLGYGAITARRYPDVS